MSAFISRGFSGRRRTPEELAGRLPPGQYAESGFPVLTAGPTPDVPTDTWRFRIDGMVGQGREWTWDQFAELPFETSPCDIHCVTKWSKLGPSFGGVSLDALLAQIELQGAYAMVWSYGGYTTNLSIDDLTGGKAWVVTEHEGEPLPREHGGPPGSSYRTFTSGRALSGSPVCA
jgi:DMSO/TMAO reductase YedYZ molybdopterin-dependent catalytic subunit